LDFDKKKNFKLIKRICSKYNIGNYIEMERIYEMNNVVQVVDLTSFGIRFNLRAPLVAKVENQLKGATTIMHKIDLPSRAIQSFYNQNFFILQLNAEKERDRLQEAQEKDEIIQFVYCLCLLLTISAFFRILSSERDNYYSKLRLIETELLHLRNINREKMKPNEKNEKLLLDRFRAILLE